MVEQTTLFSDADRFFLRRDQLDPVTLPDDLYDEETYDHYFAVYAGLAHKYRVRRIFEIGVRYGTTAICMMLGAREAQRGGRSLDVAYRGIDDESQWYGSCARANRNFEQHVPWADARCLLHNAFSGPPPEVRGMLFDLVHIDGLHHYNAVSNELRWCWSFLAPGGLIVCDDADTPGVGEAIDEFLAGKFAESDVLVRHQFVPTLRNHRLIQKATS